MQKAQQPQKKWYDRTARHRSLEQGDKVLVLLPTSTSKLLAQWHGPYDMLKKRGKATYLVDLADKKRKRVLHINLLRRWQEPESHNYFADESSEEEEEEVDELTWDGGSEGEPTIGKALTETQRAEFMELLLQNWETLTKMPACTHLISHPIKTGANNPIRLHPYRLPHAYREKVRMEIEEMERHSIIEPSNSEWAAPIVLVKKKDGSLHFCVDYRRLNAVTRSNAYPMPCIDDLIDRLGQAQYISTLDLTKGHWQVPVNGPDWHKTAFVTPYGLYQFKRMSFGLKGAPATFQRLMDQVLRGLSGFAAAYLDDVIIFSTTWEEHLAHLEKVLNQLKEAGLTAKPKCASLGSAIWAMWLVGEK